MALNPFIGLSQERLETELRQAQSDLLAGKNTIQAASGDIMIRSQPEMSLLERIRLILVALNRIDPSTYPYASITPSNATKIVFGSETSST